MKIINRTVTKESFMKLVDDNIELAKKENCPIRFWCNNMTFYLTTLDTRERYEILYDLFWGEKEENK